MNKILSLVLALCSLNLVSCANSQGQFFVPIPVPMVSVAGPRPPIVVGGGQGGYHHPQGRPPMTINRNGVRSDGYNYNHGGGMQSIARPPALNRMTFDQMSQQRRY